MQDHPDHAARPQAKGEKITMLTCYDATFAHACNQAGVEVLLVGDSLGMVLQGHDSTLPVTAEMAYHTACVKRGNTDALILADLPFMANATIEQALTNSATLMQAARTWSRSKALWLAESIRLLAERVPVCAHMGLTPQSVNILGGYKSRAVTKTRRGRCVPMRFRWNRPARPCCCSSACPANWPRKSPKR
jgi:3-methyl-2-oxobutanoate hydroxymethyltransferase